MIEFNFGALFTYALMMVGFFILTEAVKRLLFIFNEITEDPIEKKSIDKAFTVVRKIAIVLSVTGFAIMLLVDPFQTRVDTTNVGAEQTRADVQHHQETPDEFIESSNEKALVAGSVKAEKVAKKEFEVNMKEFESFITEK